MKSLLYPALFLFIAFACSSSEKDTEINIQPAYNSEQLTFRIDTLATGFRIPWGIAQLPDGRFLVTERAGKLFLAEKGKDNLEMSGLPDIRARGQGGLFDVVLHPDYENNGWIYLAYSSPEGSGGTNTAVSRYKLEGTQLVNEELIYKATPNAGTSHHYGGRIAFDEAGYLYFSIGDRGSRDQNPQDITRDGGKIYRLNDDGSIPSDNPFVNENDARKAVYSYGHRNPQGLRMNPKTGKIWEHEHGPRGGDEVNIIEKGKNYGWPVITYGINYNGTVITDETSRPGMEQPETYWDPSIAPCGMAFVNSREYPQWDGDLLVGSLKFNYIVRCDIENNEIVEREILMEDIGRVRDIYQAPDGYIYIALEGKGMIVRVVPQ